MANETILVVDDELMNRDMLSRRLKREGFEVFVASGGAEALDLLARLSIDIILLDVMMPEMSGVEVLQHVRAEYPPAALPVIMVSAASDSPQVVAALNAGANDYVTKPVNMPILSARIQSQLARRLPIAPFKAEPGAIIGNYRLETLLGRGGMAEVFEAYDKRLNRQVAVKILLAEFAAQPLASERFIREAKAMARVSHPGVVQIYEVGQKPCPYIAMEIIKGESLADLLKEKRLNIAQSASYALQIAEAIEAIHAHQIIHRDLKPGNIMVDSQQRLHIMDFGLAKITEGDLSLTKSGLMLGTPQYMAPEQIDSKLGSVGPATDFFALGLILYCMLTGEILRQADSLHEMILEIINKPPASPAAKNALVPQALDELCLSLQEPDPAKRCSSIETVRQALEPYVTSTL